MKTPRIEKKHYPMRDPIRYLLENYPEGYEFQGAELGVLEGEHSLEILNALEPKRLWLVDMWQDIKISGSGTDYHGWSQDDFDQMYVRVIEKYTQYSNVSIVKMSTEAAARFLPNELDFVYIDACHDYECVKQDMTNWLPKVKIGGLLSGDDFYQAGVIKAVEEFVQLYPEYDMQTHETQWWMVKSQ